VSSFDHWFNALVLAAAEDARADGSTTVEAHHLLLAVARDGSPTLAAAGLDEAAIRRALDGEFARSLAAAGVRVDGGLPPATPAPAGSPRLGATAMAAIERGFASVSRKRDVRPAHVLLGILRAEVGTVPRALALAGADRTALIAHLEEQLR